MGWSPRAWRIAWSFHIDTSAFALAADADNGPPPGQLELQLFNSA
jgi:hypothetical protein